MITQSQLKELFTYKEGNLYWIKSPSNFVDISKPSGYLRSDGYRVVKINNKNHLAHRLIFLWHKGSLSKIIEHINNNPSDNSIENLRVANHVQNGSNHKLSSGNKSGVKGVYFCNRDNRWKGQVRSNNKKHSIPSFLLLEDATRAIKKLRKELHGEYANNG